MVKVIGYKRIMSLLILVAINAFLAAIVYAFLVPQYDKTEKDLRTTRGQVVSKRAQVDELHMQYNQIQEQQALFNDLETVGFVGAQDRSRVSKEISIIGSRIGLLDAPFTIEPAKIINNEHMQETDYVILNSPISVRVAALDDSDIYNFIYWMKYGLPGHVATTEVTLKREADIDEVSLRRIGNGIATTLIDGKIEFSWNSMVRGGEIEVLE